MLRNKVELYYTMKGKVFNCGGGGNCGTCKVCAEA
jgi:ferredoxin